VLLSEVRPGIALGFIVYRDRAGLYIKLDVDPKVEVALGKVLLAATYRRCGEAPVGRAAPPPATAASAVSDSRLIDLLNDPEFKTIYHTALGRLVKERWLAKLDGPSGDTKQVRIAGREYVMGDVCKPHDCGDNNMVLLYSPAQRVVYAKVFQRGRNSLIGAPPPPVVATLDRLWLARFRR